MKRIAIVLNKLRNNENYRESGDFGEGFKHKSNFSETVRVGIENVNKLVENGESCK